MYQQTPAEDGDQPLGHLAGDVVAGVAVLHGALPQLQPGLGVVP